MTLPAGLERLSLAALPRERWANGQGWTRPVAREDDAQGLRWRVSLAEIGGAAPFSAFPGLDRDTVLVDGGPVTLVAPDRRWTLAAPGDRAHYPGEWPLRNEAPGRPALFWNVMVARGRSEARLALLRDAAPFAAAAGDAALLWVLQGRYAVTTTGAAAATLVLGPGEGLRLRGRAATASPAWHLDPQDAGSCSLLTQLSAA